MNGIYAHPYANTLSHNIYVEIQYTNKWNEGGLNKPLYFVYTWHVLNSLCYTIFAVKYEHCIKLEALSIH